MSYYWFTRKELLQKAKDIITVVVKKKLPNIILKTRGGLKENSNNK